MYNSKPLLYILVTQSVSTQVNEDKLICCKLLGPKDAKHLIFNYSLDLQSLLHAYHLK